MATEAKSVAGAAGEGAFGQRIMRWAPHLGNGRDRDGLTCTYLTPSHRAVAASCGA